MTSPDIDEILYSECMAEDPHSDLKLCGSRFTGLYGDSRIDDLGSESDFNFYWQTTLPNIEN